MAAEILKNQDSQGMMGVKVTLPDKNHQELYHTHKYRAFGNSMYIKFYGNKGSTISLRYKDIIKVKERTTQTEVKRFESIHISGYEKNLTSNGNGNKSPKSQYTIHSARLKYFQEAKIMLIESNSIQTLYNNEGKAEKEEINPFGIILTFKEFNNIVEKVEAVNLEVECISLSESSIDNDLE